MHRISLFINSLVLALCLFSSLHAGEILPEIRAAYYYPTDKDFRDIYSDAGLYSLETSFQAWEQLYPWASLGFLYTSGHSIKEGDKTQLYMIPVGLGLKYFFNFNCFQPYLGLGVVGAYSHIHNDSSFVSRNQSSWDVGGIAKTGFLICFTNCLFLDIFCDYTYLKADFSHSSKRVIKRDADLSGVSAGAGIGYSF